MLYNNVYQYINNYIALLYTLLILPLEYIGFGGLLTIFTVYRFSLHGFLVYFLFLNIQAYINNIYITGLIGFFILEDFIGLFLTRIIFLLLIYNVFLSFLKIIPTQQFNTHYNNLYVKHKISPQNLENFFYNCNIDAEYIQFTKGRIFNNFYYSIKKNNYPVHYIYYDLVAYFKNNCIYSKIEKNIHNPQIINLTITVFNNILFTKSYYDSKKYFFSKKYFLSLLKNILGLLYFIRDDNYYYIGISSNNNFLCESIKNLYNIFIIDGFKKFSWDYMGKYMFSHILKNKNNIIYILKDNINVKNNEIDIYNYYKKLIKQLEKAILQSKLQKKDTIIFLFHQLEALQILLKSHNLYNGIVQYLISLITNSAGYCHVFIIEKNSNTIINLFFPHDNIDFNIMQQNKCVFINRSNDIKDSEKLLGYTGVENNQIPYIWHFRKHQYIEITSLPQE